MKARRTAKGALCLLAGFAIGLALAQNWPALIGLAIGSVMMGLIIYWLWLADLRAYRVWHLQEMARERSESMERGYNRGVEWRTRQQIQPSRN